MNADFEIPTEPDDERTVVDEPDEDAPATPDHLGLAVDLPEADVLDQVHEVPLDDEDGHEA